MLDANFWKDKSVSQKVIKEKKLYEELVSSYEKSINNLKDLYNLASEEKNDEILEDCNIKINQLLQTTKKIEIDWEDEIIKGSLVSRDGQLVNPALRADENRQMGEAPS